MVAVGGDGAQGHHGAVSREGVAQRVTVQHAASGSYLVLDDEVECQQAVAAELVAECCGGGVCCGECAAVPSVGVMGEDEGVAGVAVVHGEE